ncbi:MAG TPA: DUF2914 domain-containing protein [Acidiferrobacterales bacterium]|nr:DUF2914 domain-containing protein [Acidiferrobacterales bacterium]
MKNFLFAVLSLLLAASLYAAEPAAGDNMPAAAPPSAQPSPKSTPTGSVARAVFTTAMADREPVDNISSLGNNATKVYFFTELKDMAGQPVTHRWEFNGKVMSEVKFDVGAARWRVYSSKTLDPLWLGEWKVSVVDAAGSTLRANTFTYTQAAKPAPAAPSEPVATPPAK